MKKKFRKTKEIFEKSQEIQDWIESRIYECFQKKDGSFPDLEVEVKELNGNGIPPNLKRSGILPTFI